MAFIPSAAPCIRASRSAFVCPKPPATAATGSAALPSSAAAARSRRAGTTSPPRMVALPLVGDVEPLSAAITAAEVAVAVVVGGAILKTGAGLISNLSAPPQEDTSAARRAAASANEGVLGLSALKPEVKKRVSVAMKTTKPVPRDTTAQNLAALEAQAQAMFPKE